MSWLSDAHYEWHAVNGRYEICPLDCGVNEGKYDEFEMEQEASEAPAPAPTEDQMWEDPWRDWTETVPF